MARSWNLCHSHVCRQLDPRLINGAPKVFPLYDDILTIVDGIIATGEHAFRAERDDPDISNVSFETSGSFGDDEDAGADDEDQVYFKALSFPFIDLVTLEPTRIMSLRHQHKLHANVQPLQIQAPILRRNANAVPQQGSFAFVALSRPSHHQLLVRRLHPPPSLRPLSAGQELSPLLRMTMTCLLQSSSGPLISSARSRLLLTLM